jgi:alpha-galactosidase
VRPLPLLLALALAGCSSQAVETPPSCLDDATTRALAVGGQCLRLTSARVRSGGAWKALALVDVKVRTIDAGAVALGAQAAAPAEAFELVITGAHGSAIQQQGYQSWSFSGAVQIPDSVPLDADGAIAGVAAATGDPLDEVPGVSYGAALVGDPGGAGVAIAAASSAVATTVVAATGAGGEPTITVLYGAAREPLPGDGGAVHASEIVVAAAARSFDALAPIAAEIERALPGPARSPRRPIGGWYSWNQLFDKVTEDDITAHVDLVAAKLAPSGLPLLEIDDGWEMAWGDWKANDKFPAGMDGAAKSITSKGLTAGVWLAPFLVDVTSEAAKSADPGLFVQGPDGAPLQHRPSGSDRVYLVLDGTNPESMSLVMKPIASLVSSGFTYFKLDYLYAGALPGKRHDPASTGVGALHQGLDLVRTAMGPGATLNACGAPIFPLLGHADSMRIGSDTAFSGLSLGWSAVVFAARNTAARSFLGKLVWLDGDQAQVRAPYTEDEARASATVAALSGPAYALGDDLRALPADRLAIALDAAVLDLAGARAPAIPIDPLESPAEAIVASPVVDTITHPGSTGAPPPAGYTMTGKSGAKYTLTFDWTVAHAVKVTK